MVFFEERIGQILKVLESRIVKHSQAIADYEMLDHPTDQRLLSAPEEASWLPYDPKISPWNSDFCYAWFRCTVTIPEEMAGLPIYFSLKTSRQGWDALNPQFTVYVDGQIRQGFDVNHREVLLSESAQAGQSYQIQLSAYSGYGQGDLSLQGELQAQDLQTLALYYDIKTPHEIAKLLPDGSDDYILIIKALSEAVNQLDLRLPGSPAYEASVRAARAKLQEDFYAKADPHKSPTIYCVGHTHIDVAWLWPLKVTEDKALRSFSTVLKIYEEYPD